MHVLDDLFFAMHFLLFRYIAYSPWVFYYKKRVFKQRFILSKEFQDFNKCSCHYNSIKRREKWQVCFACFAIKQKSICCIVILMLFIQRRYFILAPERLIFFFSFIIANCFNNCYTTFPWLPVSNILDFKFYCNKTFCLLWKWSQVKEIEILVHDVFKSCVINFSI